jgi:hypothetical protein
MYKLLVKLMFVAALAELGLSVSKIENCHSTACILELEKASLDVLRIDWKPIIVDQEEAERFK